MSTTPIAETSAADEAARADRRTSFVEALLDNLPAWTVLAAAIAFFYLVWATLVIYDRYVGEIPKVVP